MKREEPGGVIVPNIITPQNAIISRAMTFLSEEKGIGKEIFDELATLIQTIPEPEFKWGEEVEVSYDGEIWRYAKYCCIDPNDPQNVPKPFKFHIASTIGSVNAYEHVRKRKITITLSQIAEAFKCKPEQIVIAELNK